VGLWFGGALVLLAAVLIGIDVLMRKFLARSIGGADELAGYALAVGTPGALARPARFAPISASIRSMCCSLRNSRLALDLWPWSCWSASLR